MDTAKIRRRVEGVLELLPPTFTIQDALRAMRMSKDQCRRVRGVLDEMVEDGHLFHSVATGKRLGRKPTTWSKSGPDDGCNRLLEAVQAMLPELPITFTLRDVLARLRMSVRMESRLRPVLDQLVRDVVIVAVSTYQHGEDPSVDRWSARPEKIAEELDWQRKHATLAQSSNVVDAHLERMMRPWDPFGERSAGNG